uniref:YEATS domain-containing protein n=1 Tax=Eptatretus burgeri TaxID=7764 RepID=A0A8C4QJU0_EPTBU
MASSCTVQVKLELGHRAQVRRKPTTEGFTHDWAVFVRGPDNMPIQHFVEKVIFYLHDSFPKPKRGHVACRPDNRSCCRERHVVSEPTN